MATWSGKRNQLEVCCNMTNTIWEYFQKAVPNWLPMNTSKGAYLLLFQFYGVSLRLKCGSLLKLVFLCTLGYSWIQNTITNLSNCKMVLGQPTPLSQHHTNTPKGSTAMFCQYMQSGQIILKSKSIYTCEMCHIKLIVQEFNLEVCLSDLLDIQ